MWVTHSIRSRLTLCGLTRGDEANYASVRPVAMAHDQKLKTRATAQEDETFFIFGMVRVRD